MVLKCVSFWQMLHELYQTLISGTFSGVTPPSEVFMGASIHCTPTTTRLVNTQTFHVVWASLFMKSIMSCDMGLSKGTDLPEMTAARTDSRISILYILKHVHTSITFYAMWQTAVAFWRKSNNLPRSNVTIHVIFHPHRQTISHSFDCFSTCGVRI